jgi:hypothetical protein
MFKLKTVILIITKRNISFNTRGQRSQFTYPDSWNQIILSVNLHLIQRH